MYRSFRLKTLARYPNPQALRSMSTKAPASRSKTRTRVMVSLTSCPYAPTFWMGVPPTSPGMPLMHSRPRHPSATARATSASHGSPAATSSTTRSPSRRTSTPRVRMRTTSPGNPASPTTMLLPSPRTNRGSPVRSASRTASGRSASRSRSAMREAGPPIWSVVRGARGTCGDGTHLRAALSALAAYGRESFLECGDCRKILGTSGRPLADDDSLERKDPDRDPVNVHDGSLRIFVVEGAETDPCGSRRRVDPPRHRHRARGSDVSANHRSMSRVLLFAPWITAALSPHEKKLHPTPIERLEQARSPGVRAGNRQTRGLRTCSRSGSAEVVHRREGCTESLRWSFLEVLRST